MTLTFWELYLPALAMLLGLGIVAVVVEARVRSAIRRRRVQREMKKEWMRLSQLSRSDLQREYNHAVSERVEAIGVSRMPVWTRRRLELDGLATARDKAERKIH